MSYHREMHARLLAITSDCRDDMHEPDEQGLSARVIGTYLDNAFGDSVTGEFLERGHQEIVVVLARDDDGRVEKFNLASLIALARKASV